MRLGQLARRLSVTSAEIVNFLAENSIVIDDTTNTKIGDEQLRIIVAHFAPARSEEFIKPAADIEKVFTGVQPPEEPISEEESVDKSASLASAAAPDVENLTQPVNEAQVDSASNQETGLREVIKAPKMELPGLKVIGKIDLPEKKKKEEGLPLPSESLPSNEQKPERTGRPRVERNMKRGRRSEKNPVALERERKALEIELRKKQEIEREKERRKQHYHKKVTPKGPTKAVRIYDEPLISDIENEKERPKTWWGRFVQWLTSY
jgi:hypothetical protein